MNTENIALTEKAQQKQPGVLKDLLMLLLKIVVIVAAFMLVFTFIFSITRCNDPYMTPAVKDGDLVISYRSTKNGYRPQDVIMLEYNGLKQVRRVVATAGDVVDINNYGLVINGALQQETAIYRTTERYEEGVSFPLMVPEGHVFVLADYRTNATDSRIYGCVKIEDTLGKVMTVIRRQNF